MPSGLKFEATGGSILRLLLTSVDAKHHGASLSERWNVTCMGG